MYTKRLMELKLKKWTTLIVEEQNALIQLQQPTMLGNTLKDAACMKQMK